MLSRLELARESSSGMVSQNRDNVLPLTTSENYRFSATVASQLSRLVSYPDWSVIWTGLSDYPTFTARANKMF